jgi:hypothetical protein
MLKHGGILPKNLFKSLPHFLIQNTSTPFLEVPELFFAESQIMPYLVEHHFSELFIKSFPGGSDS